MAPLATNQLRGEEGVQFWSVPAFEPPEQLNLFLLFRIFSGAPGAQHQRLFCCVTYYLRILVHVLG
jgi:hypothetical protein